MGMLLCCGAWSAVSVLAQLRGGGPMLLEPGQLAQSLPEYARGHGYQDIPIVKCVKVPC